MNKRRQSQPTALCLQGGFTLIELVTVILLLGIIGIIGGETILNAFRGVKMASEVAMLYEEGKLAMVRMEKEIHHAVPNAILVNGDQGVSGDTLSFGKIDTVAHQFIFGQYKESILATEIEDLNPTVIPAQNSLLSIYNTSWLDFSNGTTLFRVDSTGVNPMTLDSVVSAHSPTKRYYVCEAEAFRFMVTSGTLYRQRVALDTGGITGAFASQQPLASHVSQTGTIPYFQYQAGTMARNSVMSINFTLSSPDGLISLPFSKEVQVRNVP